MIPLTHILILSALLFSIGVLGVMLRRNVIVIFMSIELLVNQKKKETNINLEFYGLQDFLVLENLQLQMLQKKCYMTWVCKLIFWMVIMLEWV